jgi:hypothetical protein
MICPVSTASIVGNFRMGKRLRLHCDRLSMKSVKDRVLHLIDTEGKVGQYQVTTGLKSLAGELGVSHEAR